MGSIPSAQARQTKPACLPEQLLWSALGVSPERANARDASALSGQWAPHSSALSLRPAFVSIARAVATCSLSPEWEAQASAISFGLNASRSAAPLSISGSACSALTAERG